MSTSNITIDSPRSLFATVALGSVAIVVFNALPVILGVASDSLGLLPNELGMLAFVELGAIGLCSVSGLYWIRRVPWRPTVMVASLLLVAGNVLSAVFVDLASLVTVRFLTGLFGEGVIFTITMAAIGDARDPDRAYAYAIVGQVGLGMAALWGFPLLAESIGYQGVMGAMAALALLGFLLIPWLPAGGQKPTSPDTTAQVASEAGAFTTTFLGLGGITIWFLGLSGIWAFMERIGADIPVAQTTVGALLAVALGLGALASLLVALVGDRYGRYWPPLAVLVVHAILCLILAGPISAFIYGALVLSFTFVWNIGLPYLLGLIADSDVTGRLVVLIVSAQALGNAAGPLLAGKLIEVYGIGGVGTSSALLCLTAFVIVALFIYRMRSPQRSVAHPD